MRQMEPYSPLSHGVARVDDRLVIGGIVFAIRNGLLTRLHNLGFFPPDKLVDDVAHAVHGNELAAAQGRNRKACDVSVTERSYGHQNYDLPSDRPVKDVQPRGLNGG